MHLRAFGDARVSEVGLGCWQIGGDQWGDVAESDALDVLRASVAAGVTFLDTADVYGAGRSEELIGRFLKEHPRDKLFIASKFGRFPRPGMPGNFEPKVIREHTENSLKRLGIERLDLTQLHCLPMEQLKRAEVWDTVRALQQEGKIARFGASVESVAEAEECLKHEGCASLQIIFNIFRQTPATSGLLDRCRVKGVAVIVRLPLASGLLAGKYTRSDHLRPERSPHHQPQRREVQRRRDLRGAGLREGTRTDREAEVARADRLHAAATCAAVVPRPPRRDDDHPRRAESRASRLRTPPRATSRRFRPKHTRGSVSSS